MGNHITPDQMEALVNFAVGRLGMSPQELKKTVQTDGLAPLTSRLSPENAAKVQGMQADHREAEQLLNSPQVQELLRQLMGGNSHE